jgi:hypothetical protein
MLGGIAATTAANTALAAMITSCQIGIVKSRSRSDPGVAVDNIAHTKTMPRPTPTITPKVARMMLSPRPASRCCRSRHVAYLRVGANFERRYAWHALAAAVLLGLWLYAANTALLVGYQQPIGADQP